MAELPLWLPARDLAILFGVSEQRISQMKRKGQLKPDARNYYNVEQAKQLRNFQMSEHGVRVVAQSYSNGTGKVAPEKLTALTDGATIEVDPNAVQPSPHSEVARVSEIQELRAEKLRQEIAKAAALRRKVEGELVERAAVHSSYVGAGALIANILQNLPAEIAAIFADPETKAEVRLKVQTRIDQTQHALYSALKDFGNDEAETEGHAG